jgi:kynureninase
LRHGVRTSTSTPGLARVAGAFVHERHAANTNLNELPRYGGWWGNDPQKRFRMHLEPEFEPVASVGSRGRSVEPADPRHGSACALRWRLFDEVGMGALREKSRRLTGYLRWLLERREVGRMTFEIITPPDVDAHHGQGCQLSMLVHDDAPREPKGRFKALEQRWGGRRTSASRT